jgi:hypothetical protein
MIIQIPNQSGGHLTTANAIKVRSNAAQMLHDQYARLLGLMRHTHYGKATRRAARQTPDMSGLLAPKLIQRKTSSPSVFKLLVMRSVSTFTNAYRSVSESPDASKA